MEAVTAVAAAAVIMAVAITAVVTVMATISAAGIMAAAFSRQGASPFILRASFVLPAPHEFHGRRPSDERARTRPQLSPYRCAA